MVLENYENEMVCLHFKHGYCKFKELCRKRHYTEICNEKDCEMKKCLKRHPTVCRYYQAYGRCKFAEYCQFKHISTNFESEQEVANDLKIKMTDCMEKVASLENIIKKRDCEIDLLNKNVKELEMKLISIDTAVENLTSTFNENTKYIESSIDSMNQVTDDRVEKFEEGVKDDLLCFSSNLETLEASNESLENKFDDVTVLNQNLTTVAAKVTRIEHHLQKQIIQTRIEPQALLTPPLTSKKKAKP